MNIHDFPDDLPANAQLHYPRTIADEFTEVAQIVGDEPNLVGLARHEPRVVPTDYDPGMPVQVELPRFNRTPADGLAERQAANIPDERWQAVAETAPPSAKLAGFLGKIARRGR